MSRLTQLAERTGWPQLLLLGGLIMAAPFVPEPHLLASARHLITGRGIGWLDPIELLFHGAPLLLIAIKLWRGRRQPAAD